MIKVGITGLGFMGMIHYLAYQRLEGVKVVAMCDTIPERLKGDWRAIKGNFGPQGTMMDLTGIATYDKFDDLCADPNVDVIDICLPPCAHAEHTIKALNAGKHVFCEKPIALKAEDGIAMVAAAEKNGKRFMIGHVLPFFPSHNYVLQAKNSGRFGKLLGGNFLRVISDPVWLKNFYNMTTSGGPMLDLHIHDAQFIRLLFGMPKAVSSIGRCRGDVPEYFNTQFFYDDPSLVVTATSGCVMQQGRPFTHGYEVHFEKATIFCESFTGTPVTVLHEDGTVEKPEFAEADDITPFVNELTEVTSHIRANTNSPILDGVLARDALVLCYKEIESILKRAQVQI
ncbi:MAG: Gfo/Idh/MocA family oxidoreductase [Thermoguttaceae bacterium]|nr:Gfo/Idh/MocA family oxidoreductase [Thermoguttaceae bacterium]